MAHLTGRVVHTLLDYVNRVHVCSTLQRNIEKQEEWNDICDILSKTQLPLTVNTNMYLLCADLSKLFI